MIDTALEVVPPVDQKMIWPQIPFVPHAVASQHGLLASHVWP